MSTHPRTGAQPDPEKLARLKAALEEFAEGHSPLIDEERDKAETKIREQALRLLDQRGRSRAELKQRLLRKNQPHGAHPGRTQAHGTPTGSPQTHGDKAHGHNLGLSGNPREVDPAVDPAVEDLIDSVLDSLQANGLINDAVFANEWVRQRSASKGKSSRALDQELKAKGVASEIRHEALSQLTEEDEEETARTFAHKKAREVKNPPADRAEYDKYLRRIVGVLARRGFPSGMSLRIAREALDDRIAAVSG